MSIDLLDCVSKTYVVTAGKSPVGLRGTIQGEFSQANSTMTIRKDVGVCQPGDPGVSKEKPEVADKTVLPYSRAGTFSLNSENSTRNQNEAEGFKGSADSFFKEPKTLISFFWGG